MAAQRVASGAHNQRAADHEDQVCIQQGEKATRCSICSRTDRQRPQASLLTCELAAAYAAHREAAGTRPRRVAWFSPAALTRACAAPSGGIAGKYQAHGGSSPAKSSACNHRSANICCPRKQAELADACWRASQAPAHSPSVTVAWAGPALPSSTTSVREQPGGRRAWRFRSAS